MNQILTDAIRDVVTDVKPEVIVDLGEHIIFTQTFEVVTRDLNKKGKTHSYFQHNHIEQGTPVRPDFGVCNCLPDKDVSDRYQKTFWENDLSYNYCQLFHEQYESQLDFDWIDIGDKQDECVRGWNDYFSNPFDFDIIFMNSQLYFSDINQMLVKNKFINNQMKNGSVAIFEGGGSEHPRIHISEWEQYLPEFKVELIGVSPEQRYSVCKATYVG
jgi:hypothetical protein